MPQTSITLSPIEKKRFGYSTARAYIKSKADLPIVNEFCTKENIKLLILRCETNQINLIHALEKESFSLMDTLLYYKYTLPGKHDLSKNENISTINLKDEMRILEITRTAFTGYISHYHADPRLDIEKSNEAYLDWASRSCRKEIADEVLVARKDTKVNGFLTLRKNSPSQVEGPFFAISPEAQGQGHGKDLMKAAFQWTSDQGAKEFIISTQITNMASQNLWAGLGMKLYRALYTFHKWFDEA